MSAIYKREFRSYFTNMTGFIFLAVLFLFSGIFTTAINLIGGSALYEYTLNNMSFVLMIIIPVLAMRSVAEDKRQKTDQLLYSLPVKSSGVVIGKYLALVSVFGIAVLCMAFVPVILMLFGNVPFASTYSALLGFFLLGCALLSVCMFLSSLTESQVIAAVLGIGAMLAFYLMSGLASLYPEGKGWSLAGFLVLAALLGLIFWILTKNPILGVSLFGVCAIPLLVVYLVKGGLFEAALPKMLGYLAVFDRFSSFTGGLFDLTAVVYYLSIAVFFVFLTVQTVEKKRWN